MQVIKVVKESYKGSGLVSTFALLEWQKGYAEGVETKPDTGYLFAYPKKNLRLARNQFGSDKMFQYWLAEAEVVGKVRDGDISILEEAWSCFWKRLKLQLRNKGAEYLLCSSITLVERIKV